MKLRINPLAFEDIQSIKKYISEDLNNPDAAIAIIRDIVAAYSKLPEFPNMGSPLSSVAPISSNFRYLVCGNYLIFYKTDDDFVSVYRVLSSRQDYVRILFGN